MSVQDPTELRRARMAAELNAAGIPEDYEGPIWDTAGLQEDFEVLGFAAPFVVVRRRSDGQKGSLTFTHSPRHYFDFKETDL